MAEPLEAGIREQRLDSMRETDGALPTTGVFVPFGDVIKRFSWAPDAAVEARRGIGSVDALSHDTGPESHSAVVGYLLQGAMVEAATLVSGSVAAVSDEISWTAVKAGFDGNEITVTIVSGTADAGGISVIDKDILVETESTAIAADVVTLLLADTDVTALATPATTAASDGTLASAVKTSLADGVSTPLSEAFQRDDDGQVEARTIISRELHYEGGEASYGKRTYVVLEGCKPASARIPGAPDTPGPIQVEITYTLEKGRSYEISQPSAAAVLLVTSSETALDNGNATLTVEDDEGNQEGVPISGTSSAEYESIDAMELDAECAGTVLVQQGGASGATLAVIYGSQKYANAEGDLGVPVIPSSGSRTASLGTAYEKFLGDTITYDSGDLAMDINSIELSVDNSIETRPRNDTRKQRIIEGNRVLRLTATVMGEREYQNQITRHLQLGVEDIAWALTNTTLTLSGAALVDVGDKVVEEGQAFMSIDNVFEGTAITIA